VALEIYEREGQLVEGSGGDQVRYYKFWLVPYYVEWFLSVIQNVADPRRNACIGKVFALAEPLFQLNMEHDFRI